MKKTVLLSVFAASLFAAPVALAQEPTGLDLGATRWSNESGVWVDNNGTPATPAQIKGYNDADLGHKSEKLTRDANKLQKGETLKVDKGQAAKDAAANKMAPKAGAKPAGKVLPKTSAAK